MTALQPPPKRRCLFCGQAGESAHRFCAFCGRPLPAADDAYGQAMAASLAAERAKAEELAHRWGPARLRIYAFGAGIFAVPDAAVIFLFSRWLAPDIGWQQIGRFLLIDVASGVAAMALVLLCCRRGTWGDLLAMAIRITQVMILQVSRLVPFRDDLLNTLLFFLLPICLLLFATAVFNLHLTTVLDWLTQPKAEAKNATEDEQRIVT